uniref:Uncharacterized protein n=1 Tax=Mastacembelus armatus TaxID=205130 RepID=A0A7N8WUA9_9TELE
VSTPPSDRSQCPSFCQHFYSPGDAVAAICSATSCLRHLSDLGFTKKNVCHCPLSTNQSNIPGSKVTGLCPAHWTGRSKAAEGCVTVKYNLAGHPSQNQLTFNLKPAEDTG